MEVSEGAQAVVCVEREKDEKGEREQGQTEKQTEQARISKNNIYLGEKQGQFFQHACNTS